MLMGAGRTKSHLRGIKHRYVCWLRKGSTPDISHSWRDATGARSGLLCQDVWYYHTHLAPTLRSIEKSKTAGRQQFSAAAKFPQRAVNRRPITPIQALDPVPCSIQMSAMRRKRSLQSQGRRAWRTHVTGPYQPFVISGHTAARLPQPDLRQTSSRNAAVTRSVLGNWVHSSPLECCRCEIFPGSQ